MAQVTAVNISEKKGVRKHEVPYIDVKYRHGIVGDAHAGDWHRQISLLADESVVSPADALRIMQTGAADLVNIKLMKCGGITNALRIAAAAEVYGVECMIGCMLEAKISVNAAVELACAKKIITKIDLDGPVLCSEDHILGGAVFDEKNITVSDAPGMGIQGFVPGKVSYLD